MDQSSYLSVLISIILGLAIAQILTGFGQLIRARGSARFYWPAIIWAVLLLVLNVQTWWTMFPLRTHRNWNFFAFLVVLLQPVTLYLLAALAFPDPAAERMTDMRDNYYSQTGWFFGLIVTLLTVSIIKEIVIYGSFPKPANLAAHVVFLVATAVAALVRREFYHKFLALSAVVTLVAYIAVLFARLQ